MSDLFETHDDLDKLLEDRPLAERLRPQTLDDVIGQEHLLSKDGLIGAMVASNSLFSLILWGPPGVGKTTIARLLSLNSRCHFEQMSAIFSGVSELKKVFEAAKTRRRLGQKTLLFVDEIHRFNKSQQDSFLPYMEDGTLTLVGATTENPSFELNAALLSRAQVAILKRLDEAALERLVGQAEVEMKSPLPLSDPARVQLYAMADGDGRALLNLVQQLYAFSPKTPLGVSELMERLQQRAAQYDKGGEAHYNLISALHKSVRGSDPDAALYWFTRMLEGGEDPRYLARRITRIAVEDIALADPQANRLCLDAWQTYERLGSPEGELALAQAVVYLALAPKSNAAYVAYKQAVMLAKQTGSEPPPKHILNAPTSLMKQHGYGDGYAYDHDAEDGFSGQNYFPDGVERKTLYDPVDRGFERDLRKRVDWFARLREKRATQNE